MFLKRYEPFFYTVFRMITGFLFLWHGTQKLFNFPPAGMPIPMYIIVIGGTIEFFGGFFVMVGFATRWAAFISAGEMAYAYWTVHASAALLPIVNHGEMAVLYCFAFLFIAARGSDSISVDNLLVRRRTSADI